MEMELRINPSSMTTNDDGTLTVAGYVNKTDEKSKMLGSKQKFTEVISKGAWQRAIDNAPEIHFLAEHDKSKILASTRNGSLTLTEDDNGLYMEARISPTSWGQDYYTLIKDGILQNMSFGFRSVKDAWRNLGSHFERTVNELQLFEVSVVRDPAYASSSISARGIDLVTDEVPDSEINLRTIEIRNEDDITAIANKIFEMLQANVKVAEQHIEDPKVEDPINEDPKDPEELEKVEDPIDPEPEKVDPEPEPEPEVTDPEPVKEEPQLSPGQVEAQKIRDFINNFKEDK